MIVSYDVYARIFDFIDLDIWWNYNEIKERSVNVIDAPFNNLDGGKTSITMELY